jgi:hypothetical protein
MALSRGLRRLYSGDYNHVNQEWQPDGSVIITITGGPSGEQDRLHVADLWGENERVISEERLASGPPPWVKDRLDAARPPATDKGLPDVPR